MASLALCLLLAGSASVTALRLPMASSARTVALRACAAEDDDWACDAEVQYCLTPLGLRYIDTSEGDGEVVAPSQAAAVVAVEYKCSLLSTGQVVASSRGPVTMALGGGDLRFWDEALEGMRVGGARRVLVPPSAKVSPSQDGVVPTGDTARFECSLVRVESGLKAAAAKAKLTGMGARGNGRLRLLLFTVSCIPYLLPDELRPFLWKSGSTGDAIDAVIDTATGSDGAEKPVDAEADLLKKPSAREELRMLRDERGFLSREEAQDLYR